jgi:hypothetical protein
MAGRASPGGLLVAAASLPDRPKLADAIAGAAQKAADNLAHSPSSSQAKQLGKTLRFSQ